MQAEWVSLDTPLLLHGQVGGGRSGGVCYPPCLEDRGGWRRTLLAGNVQTIWSPLAFPCGKQRSKGVSKLVLAEEKTQNSPTTEFSKILLGTNFANMLHRPWAWAVLFLSWEWFLTAT